MSLQFHRAVEYLDVWSASSADISFVITFASPNSPGFRGRHGFLASWRPYSRMRAVKVTGSPFNTFAQAEAACNVMLGVLEQASRGAAQANNAAPPVGELEIGPALVTPKPAEGDGAFYPRREKVVEPAPGDQPHAVAVTLQPPGSR
jgi:hypothetical protein